jgi:hypothetical protein
VLDNGSVIAEIWLAAPVHDFNTVTVEVEDRSVEVIRLFSARSRGTIGSASRI